MHDADKETMYGEASQCQQRNALLAQVENDIDQLGPAVEALSKEEVLRAISSMVSTHLATSQTWLST